LVKENQERMVQQVTIEKFKFIESLTLELGRINVFIGENGSAISLKQLPWVRQQ
jgi:hypothetical protein